MKSRVMVIVLAVFVSAVFMSGCTPKAVVNDAAVATPVAEATAVPTVAAEKYTVRKGDTLWDISNTGKAYMDPFQWPLLYKANRDQIQDPDVIEIGQQFDIKKDFSAEEVNAAKEQARNTAPYKPKKAKESMPLKY